MESLAAARSAASMGNEPSDAIRVVNAVLTQIDKLRHRNNVLLMATSNISQSIDVAFIGDLYVISVSAPQSSFSLSRENFKIHLFHFTCFEHITHLLFGYADRADLKLKIGLPGPYARYRILKSCIIELMRAGIIFPWESLEDLGPESPVFITVSPQGICINAP